MAVFPESMDKLNLEDTRGSLAKIENYIRYMIERTEFAMSNTVRNVSDAGTSSVEVLVLVRELVSAMSQVQSSISSMTGGITAANNRITEMQENMTTLQESVDALVKRVEALEGGTEVQ